MTKAHKPSKVIICGGAKGPAIECLKGMMSDKEDIFIIGVDGGCLELIKAGFHLDLAIGDFDSVTQDELEMIKNQAKEVKVFNTDKDDTDMELALEYATSSFPQADYYILGGIGEQKGRLDHMLANIWMGYQARFESFVEQFSFIERNHRLQYLQAGRHQLKSQKRTDYLSIISMTPVKDLMIKNALFNLDKQDFSYPRALISNEFISEQNPVELSFSKGLVLVLWVKEDRS